MKRYVIVGNGIAAAGTIEGIRSVDREGSITVISAENHPVYCRPLISYYLEGKTKLENIGYRSADFYDKNGCVVCYGKTATKLDPSMQTVTLDDGTTIPYDSICIATGSSPFVPPMNGLDTVEKKVPFLTLDDALTLEAYCTPESRVLIVGAGLIGLKCAEGLCGRVGSITVCDLADRVLSSIFDAEAASVMESVLRDHGISFLLGDSVTQFDKNTAVMKSGTVVPFDVVVLAVGVRANTALVRDAGGTVGRGITVDCHMRTSLPAVYAAGDCTETVDFSDGKTKVMAILPNAYMEGHCAGIHMAGGTQSFANAIPMNAIGFFGVHSMSAGSKVDPTEDGCTVYMEKTERTIKKLFVRDGRLVGFMLVGDDVLDRAGIYTNLIRSGTPLCEVDFEQLKISPNLFSFGAKYRRKILGGMV